MAVEKKIKARDEFVAFAEKESEQQFSKLSMVQQSHQLARFYVKEIYNRVRTEVSDEDLSLAIVDGASDLGCDLIHRDDGHVLILQCKHRSLNSPEKPEEISHFQSALIRLRDPNLASNRLVQDQISGIDWDNDRFSLVFVTTGSLKGQAGLIADLPPQYPPGLKDLESRCDWRFIDEERLNEEYRSALAFDRGPSDKVISLYATGEKGKRGASAIIPITSGPYRSYILALDAPQIIAAYNSLDKEHIFSLNIRNFIGNTGTNRKIIETATENPESFFLYNNGISCLCSDVVVHEDRVDVKGFQVINGAQTVKALVKAAAPPKGRPASWAKALPTILVRITEIPGGYGQAGQMRERITQFNNTQNVVKVSDFRSNDSVQKHLKDQFAEIRYRGKQVEYQAKRTDRITRGSEVIRFEEFAKTIYAFLVEPTSFSGATAFLFDDQNGGYNAIFGDGKQAWEKMPEPEFRLRVGIYWIAQAFGARLKVDREEEKDADNRAALERKWMLIYAAKKVFSHYYPDDKWKDEIRASYKGNWLLGDGVRGKNFLQIYKDAKGGVMTAYRNAKLSKPGFVHRNWMRSKDTPGEIDTILKNVVLISRDALPSAGDS
jgi:AIPR protein